MLTFLVELNPYRTGPTESPTKIISAYLSAILAIGAVYDVIQIMGIFFLFQKHKQIFFIQLALDFLK